MNIRNDNVKTSIIKMDNFVRSEYNKSKKFLDYYAGKDVITKINNVKNQVIYGRRGTGKTHLLRVLQETMLDNYSKDRKLPIYIDMRNVKPFVSNDNPVYYALVVFKELALEFLKTIFENIDIIYDINPLDFNQRTYLSDKQIKLSKIFSEFNYKLEGNTFTKIGDIDFTINEIKTISQKITVSQEAALELSNQNTRDIRTGQSRIKYLTFSQINDTISELISEIDSEGVFFLIDEWSEIPLEYQPIVSELFKRAFITSSITLKIAAIPNRTVLIKDNLGLEDGGDIFGYLLDNRYIYELNPELTKSFFNELLFNHLYSNDGITYRDFLDKKTNMPLKGFINEFFANQAYREILIASAGIPRDFINIFTNSYNVFIDRNGSQKRISVADIRTATVSWYETDKKKTVDANNNAKILLNKIISDIIINRKRCHFLIPEKYENNKVLQDLIDLRVIHLRKKGISHKDIKGVTYNVYYIDYACYTSSNIYHNRINSDLLNEIETPDNFREIRRVALDDKFFDSFMLDIGDSVKCPHCFKMIDINHMAYKKQNMCYHCFEKVGN
ncbi:hypothetical protein [Ruminiclostridium cellobioparum]|uniref:hypothetical protein n=1 Tax=Ruminiclostridium cellobioparum TaxID=29355 RepID=UPI0028B068F2|nr:hypothetical protein [Ruminiclostridium cellobioparum]